MKNEVLELRGTGALDRLVLQFDNATGPVSKRFLERNASELMKVLNTVIPATTYNYLVGLMLAEEAAMAAEAAVRKRR